MGKFSDKFKDAFSTKDDGYDDDFYDDEEFADEFDEEYDDEYDYEDDYDDEPKRKEGGLFGGRKAKPAEERQSVFSRMTAPRTPAPAAHARSSSQEVCIFKPSSIEDSREITETLLDGKAVVINFEGLHVEISQRIIDFISGSCYALDGNLQKISNYIFIATPSNVDISGDFQDLLNGADDSFDFSNIKSPLL